ncbi:conserved exported protein of unknown function [Pseudomonas marincola]|uniref:DUF4124 domain-containing protein n=1 Tax=Pseudomonas marincola TaxID=437900 RepID=A0A1I7A9Q3_9PSED|nr:DUF4124 domain-containing protein [Pseudomonas marincola]MAB98983.1 DUF4124 domain-containing protein [Pseudomonadaceae bacterium]CAE6949733.1 conserved exported protein of unknown function [Pseudomonas marincola]SFT71705.1 protein of unknown function [Pseudomonas marincola]
MRRMLTCALLVIALPVSAQIYKYTDANGNTAYTNQPPDGTKVETVEVEPTNTVEIQQPSMPPPINQSDSEEQVAPYRTLQLTNLPDDEALRANNGTFSVGVQIDPRLSPAHRFQLILDGQPYGQTSSVPMLQVTNADRGEHTLAVRVVGSNGPVQQSDSVTITVQRVSTNSPALNKPTPRKSP